MARWLKRRFEALAFASRLVPPHQRNVFEEALRGIMRLVLPLYLTFQILSAPVLALCLWPHEPYRAIASMLAIEVTVLGWMALQMTPNFRLFWYGGSVLPEGSDVSALSVQCFVWNSLRIMNLILGLFWGEILAWTTLFADPLLHHVTILMFVGLIASSLVCAPIVGAVEALLLPIFFTAYLLIGSHGTRLGQILFLPVTLELTLLCVLIVGISHASGHIVSVMLLGRLQQQERADILTLLGAQTEQHVIHWLWETDSEGRIRNPAAEFCRILNISAADISAMTLSDVLCLPSPAATGPLLNSRTRILAPTLHLAHCFENRLAFRELEIAFDVGGRTVWWQLTGRPVYRDGAFLGYRGVGADITLRRSVKIAHAQRVRRDRSSGLPNRLAFTEKLQNFLLERMVDHENLVVCLIFLGSLVPESGEPLTEMEKGVLLREAAARLSREVPCFYIGRYDASKLAAVTSEKSIPDPFDRASVEDMISRICAALGEVVVLEQGRSVRVTPSVGAVLSVVDNQRADLFLDAAETALHDAMQEDGEGFSIFDQVVFYDPERRFRLLDDVRKAVEDQAFRLVYQPVINTQTGCVTGCEALSRWQGSVHGPASIQKVMSLIEETGQSYTFDLWVLETACRAASSWPEDVWIAVNMAATHFSVPGTAERILEILEREGLSPVRLQLEVTETLALDSGPQVAHAFGILDAAGVKLVLDDFGTGFSVLSYMRLYPFSKIKLDAIFIQDLLQDQRSRAIVRCAIELAVDLGMTVTAEGVSSPEHYRYLRNQGCTEAQGFFLGRPVAEEQLVWGRVAVHEAD